MARNNIFSGLLGGGLLGNFFNQQSQLQRNTPSTPLIFGGEFFGRNGATQPVPGWMPANMTGMPPVRNIGDGSYKMVVQGDPGQDPNNSRQTGTLAIVGPDGNIVTGVNGQPAVYRFDSGGALPNPNGNGTALPGLRGGNDIKQGVHHENGALATYPVTSGLIRDNFGPGFTGEDGTSFKVRIGSSEPGENADTTRFRLLIHPKKDDEVTAGCIGLASSDAVRFQNDYERLGLGEKIGKLEVYPNRDNIGLPRYYAQQADGQRISQGASRS
jgi:hypothetical protein